ncbi:hypothetical protein [Streptomyces netropsis]|uniref:Uncharacterized protein n=1 Tax=Streptomyces netropsis TaxID=55404 RepID=A0A7W7PCB8_STRNE|nr:hypothetical protein [Streptomyces netropsis]MBB4885501.1 hypothetical protein [Streptomyces netropsis]GGR38609.1 hypothetical protein GCM10010219_49670 [Streptomyces netropsis]
MTALRSTVRRSTFTYWELPVEELPLDGADAKKRLAEQEHTQSADADG